MFGLGMQEILLILVLALIFFGADKIPQLARSLGRGMSEFRRAQQELKEELDKATGPNVTAVEHPMEMESIPAQAAPPAESEPAGPVICPACNGKTIAGSIYCSQCGHCLMTKTVCSTCHREFFPEEKFCPNCGQARPA